MNARQLTEMDDPLYPPCDPCCNWCMEVGDGHWLWVEECGNADGIPVLFIHGGPGSGCNANQRRLFDPERYRVILVDQRGAGRSRPLGELRANTTAHLVADFERVRQRLGIGRWILFGGSWGSLLALAYAERHPEAVAGLVLRGIFLGSRAELETYMARAALLAPESEAVFHRLPGGDVDPFAAAAAAILRGQGGKAKAVMRAWLDYERVLMGEPARHQPLTPEQQAKVRIQMHYLSAQCFIDRETLLGRLPQLRHLPAAIVQGLADPVCPPHTAEMLASHWPEAHWLGLPGQGHGGMAPAVAAACMAALDEVAGQVSPEAR